MHQIATKKIYLAQTRALFYCQCKIKVPIAVGEAVLDDCFAMMEEVDRQYNSYQAGSYFDQINQGAGTWVTVDPTTIGLLHTLKKIAALSRGAYAVSSLPLLRSWGFYDPGRAGTPSADELLQVLPLVNDEHIEIDDHRVRIRYGQALITGSFAKALAVDRVIAYLTSQGVTDAIVNAGGSTIFALNDSSHPAWYIRLPDLMDVEQSGFRLPLTNSCLSVSGRINNYITIDNKQYGHILHAKTGRPATTSQVLVKTTTAFLGDVLSTAIFAVPPEHRDEVIASLSQEFSFHYRRIEENGDQIQSTCF